ncbi:MAG TPA: hypothetical protein VGP07_04395 [Polyangia bacterium]
MTLWLLAAAGVALWCLDDHYPLHQWLVFRYLGIWVAALAWLGACLGTGLRLLRLSGLTLPFRERLLQGTVIGVLAYALAVFLLGVAHLLGAATFFVLPLAFLAFGFPELRRAWSGARRLWRGVDGPLSRPSLLVLAAAALGLLGVTALYLNILTPGNLSYDARWYHMALAEDYAASGAIHRFPEGSFLASVPQLATYLYTWAFLVPGAGLFIHVELASHLEFLLFLVTLASLPLMVEWVAPGKRIRAAWAALFLFPGIFVYDATLNGGADHILALWTVPIVLALIRFWRTPDRRRAMLLATLIAAQVMTKYQAMYIVIPAIALFVGRGLFVVLRDARREARRETGLAMAAAAGVGLLITAILWLKNWLWYGNPVFPFMHERFATRPWSLDAHISHDFADPRWIPTGEGLARLRETLIETLRFGFRAHDWGEFHGAWPVSGFLFTLLWPIPFFLPNARRLRLLTGLTVLGVAIWYYTFHQDRYLTVLVPLMATSVLVTLNRLWNTNLAVRCAAALVVLVQLAWGSDHPFLPSHAMMGQAALKHTIDVVGSGFTKQYEGRFAVEPGLEAVGALLPKGPHTRVLIHGQHLRLGTGVPAISDAPEQQSAFAYRLWASPSEVHRQLREMGVTHVVWTPVPAIWLDWGNEMGFFDFVTHYTVDHAGAGGYAVARVPETMAALPADDLVELRFCRGRGQTRLADLQQAMVAAPQVTGTPPAGQPRFVVTENACPGELGAPYVPLTGGGGYRMWSRPLTP